ncbi:MAG: N-acetylmuramoyl-L-alanine amidase [Oricola sp.]|jgi:N-acetyl-anhydromuramyl-L-alanine amidase AmpD|nr:N-acetylmuramoyl-L-alanine amidase [Oricola sp.]
MTVSVSAQADPRDFQFDLAAKPRPAPAPLAERIHKAAWKAAPAAASLRGGAPEDAIRLVVIHATAGASTEGAVSVIREGRASFHWIVPGEGEAGHGAFVWATCPEALAAWHVRRSCAHPDVCAGATNLNRLSLGIEIVNRQNGADPFSDWQVSAAAAIVRYAAAKYPKLVHVTSHARLDPQRRRDPGSDFPWEDFMRRVMA